MEGVLVVLVVALAVGFDYTNGFHDAANAIATSVSTRALTPRMALGMAAVMNFIGALLGTAVATTIARDIVELGNQTPNIELTVVVGALIGAIIWNLLTWWRGLPSSSTHSLIGGLMGAGLALLGTGAIHWGKIVQKVVIPMIASPILGFGMAFLVMVGVLWLIRKAAPSKVNRRFRVAQTASAAAMALGHGLQDAQKTMGIIAMALFAYTAGGHHLPSWVFNPDAAAEGAYIPLWVKIVAAAAISAGTASGGWRIMRTLGRKIIELDPAHGFVAETVSATVLYVAAMGLHAPISTTHTITTAIMGVGATKRLSAVRWGVAKSIVIAWVSTIPAAAAVGALATWLVHLIVR
ncbi:MAG: inorganic phosphate transporter [Promicromonosporaceae bacterium]|nr:inorganic phosphate transporter [Promicromonosporaceae bacterium]